ncbi:hypothetical protein RB620_02835 [Paenibacillus sp. LHD-117]|uniref:hypothetical protein n=1 Tax=Paenibacillus sp. LHD-117 TaxID=3071412 RepID=UPI0027DF5814|nr:hypothetical protein [Paenibacillus sp. LHD-117]MDQ6418366.1 hypothetical protein [Paenibacillus sp. LHD-117]
MIKFVDDQIYESIKILLAYFDEHRIDVYDFYDINALEDYEDEDILIDYDTEIRFELPHTGEGYDRTLGECFEAISEVQVASIIDNYKYVSSKHVLIRVDSKDRDRVVAYNNHSPHSFETTLSINDQDIFFDLVDEFTNFALLITQMNDYDKHSPPIFYDDLFIDIRSEDDIDKEIIDELIQSYTYELSTTYDIALYISPRISYLGEEEYELTAAEEKRRLRPLIRGRGINDILTIFNSTAQINDQEYLILSFTKVIEFVSQTVVKKEMLDTILNKLDSPRALSPDSDYVLELEKTFEDLGSYKKDKEAIRLTIETCCDCLDIIKSTPLPNHLKSFSKITTNSSKEDRKQALNELAASVSDTRNRIAHAKTNYRFKGNECPKDQLEIFAKCLKVVASQVIRWFIRQHEDSRIIS